MVIVADALLYLRQPRNIHHCYDWTTMYIKDKVHQGLKLKYFYILIIIILHQLSEMHKQYIMLPGRFAESHVT